MYRAVLNLGAFEEFQYCWEDIKYPYLAKQRDYLTGNEKTAPELPDLTQESEADHWIRTSYSINLMKVSRKFQAEE